MKGTNMKMLSLIGVVLIVLGAMGLVYGGITYINRTNVVDVGDLHVQVDQQERIPLSPIGGAAAVAMGMALMFVARRQPARA
jgi:hypothetical protein